MLFRAYLVNNISEIAKYEFDVNIVRYAFILCTSKPKADWLFR